MRARHRLRWPWLLLGLGVCALVADMIWFHWVQAFLIGLSMLAAGAVVLPLALSLTTTTLNLPFALARATAVQE